MIRHFPEQFVFGVSTASYQIEGAAQKDGRAPSIWDTFSKTPGKVVNGDTGDEACDHYHRFSKDFEFLNQLNADAYRFSTAWPRILPQGTGQVNAKGLAFYDRLVDDLLQKKIQPWICLYHWDLPQALQDKGGWCNRDIQYWFTEYALIVAEHLGDRVKHFAMLNEACVTAWVGHGEGVHAPGLQDQHSMLAASHHQNLAQGRAISELRLAFPSLHLGTVLNITPGKAFVNDEAHKTAAQWYNACWNNNFVQPALLGRYPQATQAAMAKIIQSGDLDIIFQPLDFVGLNHYSCSRIAPDSTSATSTQYKEPIDVPLTDMGWGIEPQVFYNILMDLKNNYGNPPVYITENGGAFTDEVMSHGQVQDTDRIGLFHSYLNAMLDAIDQGANVKGYLLWSLLDNYEWACGYDKRFGIIHVDYNTQKRTPKASFDFMSQIMRHRVLDSQTKTIVPAKPLTTLIQMAQNYYAQGWTPATSSNFSILEDGPNPKVWITSSGLNKGRLTLADFLALDHHIPLAQQIATLPQKPSAETELHLMIYSHFPESSVVLHTHSPYASALSMTNANSTHDKADQEIVFSGYEILKAFPGIQSHEAFVSLLIYENSQDMSVLVNQINQDITHFNLPAFLIRGHGLYTWGNNLADAERHLEALEFLLHCEWLKRSMK